VFHSTLLRKDVWTIEQKFFLLNGIKREWNKSQNLANEMILKWNEIKKSLSFSFLPLNHSTPQRSLPNSPSPSQDSPEFFLNPLSSDNSFLPSDSSQTTTVKLTPPHLQAPNSTILKTNFTLHLAHSNHDNASCIIYPPNLKSRRSCLQPGHHWCPALTIPKDVKIIQKIQKTARSTAKMPNMITKQRHFVNQPPPQILGLTMPQEMNKLPSWHSDHICFSLLDIPTDS
jgi:hypothetical protein